jgi:hypothetical protein
MGWGWMHYGISASGELSLAMENACFVRESGVFEMASG